MENTCHATSIHHSDINSYFSRSSLQFRACSDSVRMSGCKQQHYARLCTIATMRTSMQREGCSQEPELFVAVGLQVCSIDSTQQRQQDADHAPEGDEDWLSGEAPKELSCPYLSLMMMMMMMIRWLWWWWWFLLRYDEIWWDEMRWDDDCPRQDDTDRFEEFWKRDASHGGW